jgi:hypothetical protein
MQRKALESWCEKTHRFSLRPNGTIGFVQSLVSPAAADPEISRLVTNIHDRH